MTWPAKVLFGLSQLVLRIARVTLSIISFFNFVFRHCLLPVYLSGKKRRGPLPGAWQIPGAPEMPFFASESNDKTIPSDKIQLISLIRFISASFANIRDSPNVFPKSRGLTQFIPTSFTLRQQKAALAALSARVSLVFSLVTAFQFTINAEAPKVHCKVARVNSGAFVNVSTSVESVPESKTRYIPTIAIQRCNESPEAWTRISSPSKVCKKVTDSEWHVPKKGKFSRAKPITAVMRQNPSPTNPFLVLLSIDEDAFQRPQFGKNTFPQGAETVIICPQTSSQDLTIMTPPIEESSEYNTDTINTLTSSSSEDLTFDTTTSTNSSFSIIENTNPTKEDFLIVEPKKTRRRRTRSQSQPSQKTSVLPPLRDSPDSFRKASSSLKVQTPSLKAPENEWQVQRKRTRKPFVETSVSESAKHSKTNIFAILATDEQDLQSSS